MNDYQKNRFAQKMIETMFKTVSGKKIGVLGFAFKKDTGDARESSSAYVCATLLKERSVVHVYDPKVTRPTMLEELAYSCGIKPDNCALDKLFHAVPDVYEAVAGADAVAVLTEWDMFKALDWHRVYAEMQKPAFVFDGRNILDHRALREIGFVVYAIGKPIRDEGVPSSTPRY
jgi:UDPglucose 6-dehydrogenase